MKCAVPVPWEKELDKFKIKQKLSTFLANSSWQVQISGNIVEANQLMKDLKEINVKKRDHKELYKGF